MLRTIVPILLFLAASPAWAEPGPPLALPHTAHLTYTAPKSCPDEQVLRDLIGGQTTVKVLAPDAKALLTVTVVRHDRLYEASAELRDEAGAVLWTRPFAPASSCSDLLQNVALVVSEKLEPRAKALPAADTSRSPDTAQPPPSAERPTTPDPLLLVVGLGATLGFGRAPRPAVGMTADIGLHCSLDAGPLNGFSLALGARWDPPAGAQIEGRNPGTHVVISHALGTIAPCAHVWKLFGCALGALGQIGVANEGNGVPAARHGFYAEAGGRIGIELPIAPPVGFRAFGEVLGTLTPAIAVIDRVPWWTTPPVSGSVGAGAYFFF